MINDDNETPAFCVTWTILYYYNTFWRLVFSPADTLLSIINSLCFEG